MLIEYVCVLVFLCNSSVLLTDKVIMEFILFIYLWIIYGSMRGPHAIWHINDSVVMSNESEMMLS
jgi:hypothetical protein